MPEAKLADMLGAAVTQIQLPAHVAADILTSLRSDQEKIDFERKQVLDSASKRLNEIEQFKHQTYQDRLCGTIDEKLWSSMSDEWRTEELRLQAALEKASSTDMSSRGDRIRKIFELAQMDQNKWLMLSMPEQAKLARIVLSNCSTDGVKLTFDYRKPFDRIVNRAKKRRMAEARGRFSNSDCYRV